ncbi:High-affinity branched-chain amino acid transport system permease protein LivH [Anaerolineae bacterium]|nr:High-affinity branched-chain amino acid transport system permease protein LivH [Anaerolineae bacterium]
MTLIKQNRNALVATLIILVILALAFNGMSGQTASSIILSGVTLAALYFLVASGVSLIFGLMDVLNFAHGSLFMVGAYAGWTFYTNPRLLFNTAPIALALIAGFAFGPILARFIALPRWARWLGVFVGLAIALVAVRDFPIDKLVAMGMTMTGKIIPTAEAQEPIATMLMRIVGVFVAGAVAGAATNTRSAERLESPLRRTLGIVVGLVVAGLVVLFVRDAGEQLILTMESNWRFLLALGAGAATGGALGALMEWGLIRPLYSRPIYQILLTLGLTFVFDQVVRFVWGPAGAFMEIPKWFSTQSKDCPSDNLLVWFGQHCDSIFIMGRPFPSYRLFIILVGVVMVFGIVLLLQRTRFGMIIRAGVQDSEMVEALGINVRRVFTLVFAIGAALAGLGGVVAAPFLGVYPGMAMEFLLQAFIVVVIGGLGSIPGAVVGALLVGLARAYGDHIVLAGIQLPWMTDAISGSPAIARASTVLIMAIVLFLKPTGIFGKKD